MKRILLVPCIAGLLLAGGPPARADHQAKAEKPSAAYRWLDIGLEATARQVDRHAPWPTVISRFTAIIATSMYDAWAAYDEHAVGTRLGGTLRRPKAEHTDANKERAIAYACYRAMLFCYGDEDAKWIKEQMAQSGLDPENASTDVTTPEGIGNVAAKALCDYRRNDGANQFGDEIGTEPKGKPYADYTKYKPVNTADKCVDPDRWQPISFDDGKGGKVTPGFLTPHWYRVKTFALESPDQFRPPPPPLVGSPELKKEVDECIMYNSTLTPEQKAIVEFMRDGPRSTGQSGHWLRFAQDVSRRDKHGIDQDVKLFMAVANVAMDAFISCWECKRHYDNSRPWTLIRFHYYPGKKIRGWMGPGKGVGEIDGSQWLPYSPSTFITPPFPAYTSGHATVSGASAKMLELFTGSDRYEEVEKRRAGVLTEADHDCKEMQKQDGKHLSDPKHESCNVVLKLPTFSATAEMAALSRCMGGYHIPADNNVGLEYGRKIAVYCWPKIKAYFDGTAPEPK